MQSVFPLKWCSEQLKLSERAAFDKMRPAPKVEIPLLNGLKRKLSSCSEVPALHQVKKQRPEAEYPQQLLTPCSPHVTDERVFPQPSNLQPALPASGPASTPALAPALSTLTNETPTQHESELQTTGGAERSDINSGTGKTPSNNNKIRADSGSGGYFSSKPDEDDCTGARNTMPLPSSGLTPLQQVIENEFNMQILMKHNELRLIEQELAKCQVALEQLRRCELRPFPGSSGLDPAVSTGTGPAVAPPPGYSRPSHAPPYGVTDGPYTRHYRQWLLHDPQFDPTSPQAIAQAERMANHGGRPTRNTGHSDKAMRKSIATSTRAADALQSIPNYPAPAAKDKNAGQILRRSTDQKLVKLVCPDSKCRRFNFSSIQGFLNHCRIAHKIDYKSHDAAAIDCGEILNEQEIANLPAETQALGGPKPAPSSRRTESVSIAPSKNALNFVHPLNTPAATPVNTPGPRCTAESKPIASPMPKLDIRTPQSLQSAKFKPAANLPRLSAHFVKHRVGGDLALAVANAQQKIDLGADDEDSSPDTPDAGSPVVTFAGGKHMAFAVGGGKRPGARDGNPSQRPESSKGFRQAIQRPRPPPLAPAPTRLPVTQSTLSSPHEFGLASYSPNPVDSNPGLVSDHEDDDHASGSDEESSQLEVATQTHPLQRARRSCEDDMDIDVQDDDELDQHGVIIRRNSMVAEEARGIRASESVGRKPVGN